jgi:hypothetical protein
MSTNVYTDLNPFKFIQKHFLQIYLWDISYVHVFAVLTFRNRGSYI